MDREQLLKLCDVSLACLPGKTTNHIEKILATALRERLVGEQKQLPQEFVKVADKEFWNLLDSSPEPSDGK